MDDVRQIFRYFGRVQRETDLLGERPARERGGRTGRPATESPKTVAGR
jgi:hypothetical protein